MRLLLLTLVMGFGPLTTAMFIPGIPDPGPFPTAGSSGFPVSGPFPTAGSSGFPVSGPFTTEGSSGFPVSGPFPTEGVTGFPVSGTPHPYIVYMPKVHVQDVEFFVYFLIINVTASELTYIVKFNQRTAVKEKLPYVPVRIFTIDHARFTENRYYAIVDVIVSDGGKELFSKSVEIYRSWGGGPAPEKSLFIQRDKALYKPNDKVRFRCFGLDNKLQVLKEPIDIKLYDPNNNLMQIWHRENSSTGVISADAQLSDRPVLGKWTLQINQLNSDLNSKVTFDVKEFVLPSIKVTLESAKYVYHLTRPSVFLSRHYIDITVDARYSFGGPVQGIVDLQVTLMSNNKYSIRIQKKINGGIWIRLKLQRFLKINTLNDVRQYYLMPTIHDFKITAVVHENETGSKIESTPIFVKIAPAPIEIDAPYSIAHKPGLPSTFVVNIIRIDDNPLTPADIKEKLNVTYIIGKYVTYRLYPIPEDGRVIITAPLGIEKYIKISYYGIYQRSHYIRTRQIHVEKFKSPINAYMMATLREGKIYAGDPIRGSIISTVPLENIYYLVLKDESPVANGMISPTGLSFDFHIESKEYWYPGVKIIFTCFTTSGDILVDILAVKLEAKFKYKVEGQFSPRINSAREPTQLNMNSTPESVLFVMSVDERLDYLEKNKYITREEIFSRIGGSFPVTPLYYVHSAQDLFRHYRIAFTSNKIKRGYPYIDVYDMPIHMPRLIPIGRNAFTTEENAVVRDNFQDVWIWAERNVSSRGTMDLSTITPDSITTWKTHAFAVHPEKGISVLEKPLKFVSFQTMFIKLRLPYSVIQSETLILVATVFNYLPFTMNVSVTVAASGLALLDGRSRTILVQKRSYRSVEFKVRAVRIGDAPIEMSLRSGGKRYDTIIKTLLVKPVGRPVYFNKELPIELNGIDPVVVPFEIKIPEFGVVRNSVRIEVSVTGDIMGPILENLGSLVRLPQGCGEQTALSFVPNVVIYNYLKIHKALDPKIKQKIIQYTENGYKNQLRYQKIVGSFSAFQSDKKGSVWLTAFIDDAFQMVIDSNMGVLIDKEKLEISLGWLMYKQQADGGFRETGHVIHKKMQGGAGDGHALTAYVVNSILALRSHDNNTAERVIKKGLAFMNNLDFETLDVYTLCIFLYTYANNGLDAQFNEIEAILLEKVSRDGNMMYWKGENEIEQTAYVLLAIATKKNYKNSNGISILRWLLSKRSSLGGYSNTQDTIVALKAMSAYALLTYEACDADVVINSGKYTERFTPITHINCYVLQKKTMPSRFRNFEVIATGKSKVYVAFSWSYNELTAPDYNFGLSITTQTHLINKNLFTLCICFEWTKTGDSGMVVSEVLLPSGFAMRSLSCKNESCESEIIENPGTLCWNKYDYKDGTVTIYMNELTTGKPVCSEILSDRQYLVENRDSPIYFNTYLYYNEEVIIKSYNPFKKK